MEYGFKVPTNGPLATPDSLATLARRGEEMGFSIMGVSDHIVIPDIIRSTYPYSESGEYGRGDGDCLDQLTLLSFLAGVTASVRLLTSVMVLPHRSPVLAAKMLATIDVLSGGRLTVGCGVGWMEEEFESIGAPPFGKRGAVGSEYIRVFKELWTSDSPQFQGSYAEFGDLTFAPKPVQKPHPPIWVGGESPQALRRAATLGDGWYPIGTNPSYPLGTPEQFAVALQALGRHAERAGRDPSEIDLAYSIGWCDDPSVGMRPGGQRPCFTGAPEQVAGGPAGLSRLGRPTPHYRLPSRVGGGDPGAHGAVHGAGCSLGRRLTAGVG